MSCCEIAPNSAFMITMPVRRTSTLGSRSIARRASARADAATSGTSSRCLPGSWMVTLTPAWAPSGETRRPTSRGSWSATRRIFFSSRSSRCSGSSTKSATLRSSPSASVCWKLVRESTRME